MVTQDTGDSLKLASGVSVVPDTPMSVPESMIQIEEVDASVERSSVYSGGLTSEIDKEDSMLNKNSVDNNGGGGDGGLVEARHSM